MVKQQLAPSGILCAGINSSNFLLVFGTAADGSPRGITPDIANHSGLRMNDPPFTAVEQSIENGWIAAQLELHGMTGKLGKDPH